MPYAPVHLAGSRNPAGDLAITWVRRSRLGGAWRDGTGTVPLGRGERGLRGRHPDRTGRQHRPHADRAHQPCCHLHRRPADRRLRRAAGRGPPPRRPALGRGRPRLPRPCEPVNEHAQPRHPAHRRQPEPEGGHRQRRLRPARRGDLRADRDQPDRADLAAGAGARHRPALRRAAARPEPSRRRVRAWWCPPTASPTRCATCRAVRSRCARPRVQASPSPMARCGCSTPTAPTWSTCRPPRSAGSRRWTISPTSTPRPPRRARATACAGTAPPGCRRRAGSMSACSSPTGPRPEPWCSSSSWCGPSPCRPGSPARAAMPAPPPPPRRSSTCARTAARSAPPASPPAAPTASFTLASATSLAEGDRLELIAPTPQDATLADLTILLKGSLA